MLYIRYCIQWLNSHDLVNTSFFLKYGATSKDSSEAQAESEKVRICSREIGKMVAERSIAADNELHLDLLNQIGASSPHIYVKYLQTPFSMSSGSSSRKLPKHKHHMGCGGTHL